MVVIGLFFSLEIFYHGILKIFGFPYSRETEEMFYIFHECTDALLLGYLLYTLRTRDYIPYYGIVNLDNNNLENNPNDIEMGYVNRAETLEYIVNQKTYSDNTSSDALRFLTSGDHVIIVDPEGPDPAEFRRMTVLNKYLSEFRKLKIGVLKVNHSENSDLEPLFYEPEFTTQIYNKEME